MNASASTPRTWDKVEQGASLFVLFVLFCILGMRLGFDDVWRMPALDFALCVVALLLVVAGLWFGRRHRGMRLWIIAFASATQLVPMVVRQPVLLFPLLGALIPIAILGGCLVALSHKDSSHDPQSHS
jgi:hypothetical protein